MNRGSIARRVDRPQLECAFNEAPIHESGKSHPSMSDCHATIDLQ